MFNELSYHKFIPCICPECKGQLIKQDGYKTYNMTALLIEDNCINVTCHHCKESYYIYFDNNKATKIEKLNINIPKIRNLNSL